MKKVMAICGILFLLNSLIYSQTNTSDKMIWLRENYFLTSPSGASSLSYDFKIGENGAIQSAGFFGEGIRPYLQDNPNAMKELDKFKSKRTLSFIGYSGVFAGMVFIMAVGPNKNANGTYIDIDGKEKQKKKLNPIALVGFGVSLTGLFIGGYNYFSAAQHMKNAVNIYNSDINKVSKKLQGQFSPLLWKDSFILNYSLRW